MTADQHPRFQRVAQSPKLDVRTVGLGDAVEVVAKPIGAAFDSLTRHLPAGLQTNFKAGNCGCAERKAALNAAVPDIHPSRFLRRLTSRSGLE